LSHKIKLGKFVEQLGQLISDGGARFVSFRPVVNNGIPLLTPFRVLPYVLDVLVLPYVLDVLVLTYVLDVLVLPYVLDVLVLPYVLDVLATTINHSVSMFISPTTSQRC
jgi:hypothetical protein